MTNKTYEHRDKLGRIINIDDFVATASRNMLTVGKIVKLNPKMVQISIIDPQKCSYRDTVNKYPDDTVIIKSPDVSLYLLKNSS